jgi:hypothetical protein
MGLLIKLAWATLALIHVSPAAALFSPNLVRALYGIDANATLGVLITHRGALFLAVVIACIFALFDPNASRLASTVVALSIIGFLIVYAKAKFPDGALRTVALVDLFALIPLALVLFAAWRPRAP